MTPLLVESVNAMAPILSKMFNISDNAAKGVFWLTARDWQIKNHKTHEELIKMNETEYNKSFIELFEILRERVMKLLVNPEEQKELLDETIDKILNIAQEFGKKRK